MTAVRNTTFFLANISYGLVPAVTLLALLLVSKNSFGSNQEVDILCRAKAKETAATAYKSCMDEQREAQLDSLKKSYEEKLKAMRDEYEKELTQLSGKKLDASKSKKVKPKAAAKKNVKKAGKTQQAKKKSGPKVIELAPYEISNEADGVTFQEEQLSGAIQTDEMDESSMDIPEPIPVELPSEIN